MNREIKFRAVDLSGNYITEIGSIEFFIDGQIIVNDEIPVKHLLQFTGLKDKYGTDIYDCDILKFIGGTCDILHNGLYNYQYYEKGAKLVVQCLLSGFTLRNPSHIGDGNLSNRVGNVKNYDFWNHSTSLIVIGNTFQNPELLP